MKTFKCPHNEIKADCEEVYCRQCNSLIFSIEETKRREIKLSRLITNNPRVVVTIKFMETFK